MTEPREEFEMAGTFHNLAGLRQLLSGWRCCGLVSICNGPCLSSELTMTLATAFDLVEKEIERKFGKDILDELSRIMEKK